MASRNTLPTSHSSDYSEIHDMLIVPPQPIPQKEYKEEVPDISVVSDVVDNGSPLLPTSNNFLRASLQQEQRNKPFAYKTGRDITERTNAILDCNARFPVMTYLNPSCQSCIINHAAMTNKGYNEHYVLPKPSAPILLPVGNEQSDKEMRFKYVDDSNKTCPKHVESNETASSHHKSIVCGHVKLSHPLNSNGPEAFEIEGITNYHGYKDQPSELQKSLCECERTVSSDVRLGKLRKSEETCEKDTDDRNILKGMNLMCPACFRKPGARKPCTCNFSSKEYNANLNASSDALSSIWEYLKQQDEKIDSIQEKVSNFLSQHASCLINQPTQGNEFSDAIESDIPYILNILQVHSDKIKELQDEINLLKSREHKFSLANNKIDESVFNAAKTINCVNTETRREDICCPYSHNAVCHQKKQEITKSSTSTMTSLVIENNDIVYHKQMTVVTGMREKKESSCLPNEHDSPTMKKQLGDKNVNSKSQKKKSPKLKNCSPSLKCSQNVSSNSSSDLADHNDKTSLKSEKKSKRASTRNKVIDKSVQTEDQPYATKSKNVLKNVDDRALKANDVEGKNISPALKTTVLKSHSRSSKQKPRNSTSPKVVDTAVLRDLGNKNVTVQISESPSNTGAEHDRTKQRLKMFETELDSEEADPDSEESTTVSKYGLSSENLSMATKRYLDTYGLRRTRRLSDQ